MTVKAGSARVLPLVVAIALCIACSGRGGGNPSPEIVKIGAVYPLTGPLASTGLELKAAIELAVEAANGGVDLPSPMAAHGKQAPRRRIEVIFKDYGEDTANAAAAVDELVAKDGVAAIIGCYQSAATTVASERAEVLGIPFLNAESTAAILSARGFKWFFRTTPDDEVFVTNLFAFLKDAREENPDLPRKVVLVYENKVWGTGVAQAEKRAAAQNGFTIVADIPYDSKKTDFSAELAQIAAAMPAVILQASYDADAVAFMQGYIDRKIPSSLVLAMDAGFVGSFFMTRMGAKADGVLSRDVFARGADGGSALFKEVSRLYKARSGKELNGNSARSFTGLMTLADAIGRSKSGKPEDIREALRATNIAKEAIIMPWDGVSFDAATGQNNKGRGVIVQMQGGQYLPVWPKAYAEAPIRWRASK